MRPGHPSAVGRNRWCTALWSSAPNGVTTHDASGDAVVVVEVARRGKLVVGEPYFTRRRCRSCSTARGSATRRPGDLVARPADARPRARRARARARRPDRDRARGAARRDRRAAGVRAVRAARADARGPRRPARADDASRSTPRRRRTSTTRSRSTTTRAYVHIADVSYFIPAGSPLDRGAAQRGFSTYVPGLVAPMLPPELADDLCSLRPHVDRLCVTVELPLDDGEPSFYRSVIRSDARLSYGQAQRILAGAESFAHARRPRPPRRTRARASPPPLRARCAADSDAGGRSSTSTAAAESQARTAKASPRRTRSSRSS